GRFPPLDVFGLDPAGHELRVEASPEHPRQVEVAFTGFRPEVFSVVQEAADRVRVAVDDDRVEMKLKRIDHGGFPPLFRSRLYGAAGSLASSGAGIGAGAGAAACSRCG